MLASLSLLIASLIWIIHIGDRFKRLSRIIPKRTLKFKVFYGIEEFDEFVRYFTISTSLIAFSFLIDANFPQSPVFQVIVIAMMSIAGRMMMVPLWILSDNWIGKYSILEFMLDNLYSDEEWGSLKSVLDFGCGNGMASAAAGIILERNNNRNAEVIGVDQAKFLKKYAGHLKNEKLQVANISARDAKLDELPNEWTGKFDLVISNFSLSRCISNSSSPVTESRAKLLSEMIKCLRPGGRLAIFDANQTCIHYEYLLKRNDQVSDVLKTPEVPVGHKSHIVFATRSK